MRIYWITIIFMLVMSVNLVLAQTPAPAPEQPKTVANTLPVSDILSSSVTCDFSNTDFPVIVADLAKQAGVDILVDPNIVGKISTNLGQTTLVTALDRICALVGAFYDLVGPKAIAIASPNPKGPYFSYIAQTEVIHVNFFKVKQILSLLANYPFLGYLAFDEASNQISITAPSSIIEKIKADINRIDVEQPCILIEASVLDTSSKSNKDTGSQWKISQGPKNEDGVWTLQWGNTVLGYSDKRMGEILFNLFNFNSSDSLKILSQPKLVVRNNEQAEIFFGIDQYIVTTIVYGGNQPGSIAPVKSGTQLAIKPRFLPAKNSGEVNKINVEIIKGDASETLATGTQGLPSVNRRTFSTNVDVRIGETIIIGGFDSSLDYNVDSKVPFFGDLPLIGGLFRSSRKENRKQEITVFMTLYVLKPDEATIVKEKDMGAKTEKAVEKAEERQPNLEGEEKPPPSDSK